jgi:hypothetical protein
LRLYDADLDTKRYKVKDVRIFSKKQKSKKIRDLAAWKKYCRKFLRIAGPLNGSKISQKEYSVLASLFTPLSLFTPIGKVLQFCLNLHKNYFTT